jgi:hypothetical protein
VVGLGTVVARREIHAMVDEVGGVVQEEEVGIEDGLGHRLIGEVVMIAIVAVEAGVR